MLHEGQEYIMMDSNSSYENVFNRNEEVIEGEDDYENYEDNANDLYVPPSNFETTVKDPHLATFVRELLQNENNGYVASFQKICYFNGADSYAVNINCSFLFFYISQNLLIFLGGAENKNIYLFIIIIFFLLHFF
jgi:hypothetical protein